VGPGQAPSHLAEGMVMRKSKLRRYAHDFAAVVAALAVILKALQEAGVF